LRRDSTFISNVDDACMRRGSIELSIRISHATIRALEHPQTEQMMSCIRSASISAAGITLALAVFAAHAGEGGTQSYPNRPVRIIAPISAGGGADVAARMLAKSMSGTLQQQVIIENRAGGGSVLGTTTAANATADGYTILWISGAHAINAAFNRRLPYDSIKSFEPVALFAKMPFVLVVHPSLPAATMPELLALVRSSPGKFNYASSGTGSASHLGLEMLKLYAKLDMVNISYKGAAPSIAGLLGGEVQMAMLGPLSVKPHIASGKVRGLAVTTAKRSAAFPSLPTVAESVPKYEMTSWYGILAPAGTPRAAIVRLNTAVAAAQSDKAVVDTLAPEGAELVRLTPQQFGEYLKAEIAKYAELSRRLDIKLE
jgi:tripartite-type tricarboxylate transporter receptor subunit TctC